MTPNLICRRKDSPLRDRWTHSVPLNQLSQRLVEVVCPKRGITHKQHIFYSTFSSNKHTSSVPCATKNDTSHKSHFNVNFLCIILIQLLIEGLRRTFIDDTFPLLISSFHLQHSPSTHSCSCPLFSPQGDNLRFGSIPERPLGPLPFIANQSQ